MKNKDIKLVCDKCGKDVPVDKKKTTENWTYYKMNCRCGGKGTLKFPEFEEKFPTLIK